MALAAFNPGDLQDFTRTFEDLFYAADAASMTSYYTEHAQLMADGIDPLQGRAAIAEFWRAAIARAAAARARRTIRLHESHSSGDLGYALCTVTVDIPQATAPPAPASRSGTPPSGSAIPAEPGASPSISPPRCPGLSSTSR